MADISAGRAATASAPDDSARQAREVQDGAARRFEDRKSLRREKMDRLAAGAAVADTPERLAKRSDRLRRYRAGEQLRSAPVVVPAAEPGAMAAAGAMLERVINNPDFVDGSSFAASGMAPPVIGPAPALGEHTAEIARELLGLTDDAIEQLIASGVLEVPLTRPTD